MNGKEYTYNSDYNINASFNEKKYKNGFHYINNGVELCFGITNYGKNTYILSYDISNFVVNTSDGYQMIYWTLFPKNYNPSPIKIYSDFKYADTLDVWGYGKYGAPTYVYDGYIEMDSESTVTSSEYMTILVKFPENTFTLNTTLDKTFDEYLSKVVLNIIVVPVEMTIMETITMMTIMIILLVFLPIFGKDLLIFFYLEYHYL